MLQSCHPFYQKRTNGLYLIMVFIIVYFLCYQTFERWSIEAIEIKIHQHPGGFIINIQRLNLVQPHILQAFA